MKIVYVSSPFQGNEENLERARRYCRLVVSKGYLPLTPHVYFSQFMDDKNPEDRKLAMEMNKKLVEFADEMWVFGNKITEGMKEEIEYFTKVKGKDKINWVSDEDIERMLTLDSR
ncbi:MAG: DUF4406 domain-containing protein [Candidatus Aenigmarchaeota archaeon]|nr:DUF4406 domain-containing protein [Candidatus Aenigmarchaeota archaeon]